MDATDLDALVDCWVCSGSGDDPVAKNGACRFCGGGGEANHYGPEHPGEQGQDNDGDHVIMDAWVNPSNDALYTHRLTVDHPTMPAFNQRFGPSTNADLSEPPKSEYAQDTLDQLNNEPIGTNTNTDNVYAVNGREVAESKFPGGSWPGGGDLTPKQAEAWQRARGDSGLANELAAIADRLDL